MALRIKLATILLILTKFANLQAQTCDCGKDFDFLTSAYQKDYAGIQDFIKAHPSFLDEIHKMSQKSKKIKNIKQCDKLIGKLISYINNGHVRYGKTQENPLYQENTPTQQGSSEPKIDFLDPQTVLFHIPTCDLSYKATLDSLIAENKNKLDKTPHFIIDLRGNGGGGDAMFEKLIPYLYTNPILRYTAELWASENNIKLFDDLLSNPNIPAESKTFIQKIVENAKSKPNQFVSFVENKVDTFTLNTVSQFPSKVSILIDHHCASATEEFLLLAKQSKKTTIYGYTNSYGALDYSNLNVVITPSGYWYASVPTTRTTRLPENPVDPMGIKPDVQVSKKVKDMLLWVRQQ